MMNDIIISVVAIAWIIASYTIYYWIGKLAGGLKHGKLIAAGIITLLWVINSVVNAGGIDWLVWLIRHVSGFWFGWIASLGTMLAVTFRGIRNHVILTKEKWLI